MTGHEPYQLDILEGSWGSLRLGYDLPGAWSILQRVEPAAVALSLTPADVDSYHWADQSLTLTREATQAIVARLAQDDEQREYPEAALDQRAFLARLDANPIYGGIFLHPMSSMGIGFPVIYPATKDGQLTFTLRPVHSILGVYTAQEPAWSGIKDPRVRDVFARAGKLVNG